MGKPLGYWWRRDGGVAVVAHIKVAQTVGLWFGLIFDAAGNCLAWASWHDDGRWLHRGDHDHDLIDYIGPEPPTIYKRPREKKWRPWTAEEAISHADHWISDKNLERFHRVAGWTVFGDLFRGGVWYTPLELLANCWWRESPSHQPQRCGVEEEA